MNQLSMPNNELCSMKRIMRAQQEYLESLSSKLTLLSSHGGYHHSIVPATVQSKPKQVMKPTPMFGRKQQFPEKLYELLEMADQQNFGCYSDAVSWMPHGRAFKVRDEDIFMKNIAPLFFNQTKLRSFNRQLGLWGFKRFNAGLDVGGWYHESFVRGSPNQMQKMVRIKVKGATACSDDRKEPNFYMPANNLQSVPSKNLRRNISYTELSLSSNEASVDRVISQALTIPKQIHMARSRRVSMDYAVPSSVSSACNHRFEEFPDSQRVPSESMDPSTSTADQPIDEFAQFIDAMIHVL